MSVKFDTLNQAFNTIAYPFNNILVTLIRGTATTKVLKPNAPILVRIVKPTIPITTRIAKPTAPTYTRIQ